jgi:hypothetical protein
MKTLLSTGWLALLSCTAIFGAPCVPGNYQSFINLGASGCEIETVHFDSFRDLRGLPIGIPGQTVGTPIDPAQVQVTPGGTASNPMFLFTLNKTATAHEVFESYFVFLAPGSLIGSSITLIAPTVTGDGDAGVFGLLDVCPSFAGATPIACGTPQSFTSQIVNATGQGFFVSNSRNISVASEFGFVVFVDLITAGGRSGSATLGSSSVGFSTVPEPSAGLLVALGLSAFGVSRARGRRFSGEVYAADQRNSRFYPRVFLAMPPGFTASQRQALITALDHKAKSRIFSSFRSRDGA